MSWQDDEMIEQGYIIKKDYIESLGDEIKDFECREVLEGFYQNETYEYFFSCMKSEYNFYQ